MNSSLRIRIRVGEKLRILWIRTRNTAWRFTLRRGGRAVRAAGGACRLQESTSASLLSTWPSPGKIMKPLVIGKIKKNRVVLSSLSPLPLTPFIRNHTREIKKEIWKKEEEKVKIQFSFYFFPIFSNVLPKICIPYCTHYNIADFSRELCEFRYVDKINSTLNCYILEMFEIV